MEANLFKIVDSVPWYLNCPICLEIFNIPTRSQCGHTFCSDCILQWCKKTKTCPSCRQAIKIKHNSNDLIAQSIINDLKIECSTKNCIWRGKFEEFKAHKNNCEGLTYSAIENEILELLDSQVPVDEIILGQIEKGKPQEFIAKIFEILDMKASKRKISDTKHLKSRQNKPK